MFPQSILHCFSSQFFYYWKMTASLHMYTLRSERYVIQLGLNVFIFLVRLQQQLITLSLVESIAITMAQ